MQLCINLEYPQDILRFTELFYIYIRYISYIYLLYYRKIFMHRKKPDSLQIELNIHQSDRVKKIYKTTYNRTDAFLVLKAIDLLVQHISCKIRV